VVVPYGINDPDPAKMEGRGTPADRSRRSIAGCRCFAAAAISSSWPGIHEKKAGDLLLQAFARHSAGRSGDGPW